MMFLSCGKNLTRISVVDYSWVLFNIVLTRYASENPNDEDKKVMSLRETRYALTYSTTKKGIH